MTFKSKPCKIDAGSAGRVSGLLTTPAEPQACYAFAHGAGAGMTHPFMEQVAQGLAERGVATLRYQFAYMEHGARRPDPPKLAHAVVRAAVAQASQLVPGVPMLAGGKSFGGRMTSQAQALAPMANIRGLVFFGFPLHPAGKPSDERGKHLFDVTIPMLLLQGTRDALAEQRLLEPLVEKLGDRAILKLLPDADHSFHVPARSGRTDNETLAVALDAFATWSAAIGRRR